MKLGLVSDSLGGLPFQAVLDHAVRIGVSGVEVNTGSWSAALHFDLAAMKSNVHIVEDGRVVAASAVGPISKIGKDARLAEMLISKEVRPGHDDLGSPEFNLKGLLTGRVKNAS